MGIVALKIWCLLCLLVCFYCAGFLLLCRFFLAAANRGYSLGAVHGLLIVAVSLFVEPGL